MHSFGTELLALLQPVVIAVSGQTTDLLLYYKDIYREHFPDAANALF